MKPPSARHRFLCRIRQLDGLLSGCTNNPAWASDSLARGESFFCRLRDGIERHFDAALSGHLNQAISCSPLTQPVYLGSKVRRRSERS
jgi:hypothetical protein